LRFPAADYREKIWDHAAGAVIVTEAGGRITDGSGAPLDFGRGRYTERNIEMNVVILSGLSAALRGRPLLFLHAHH
jgi:3'-phosphoadenosine 5'-phosphosulfate (PAPS) 3'-phosphatase